MKRLAIALLASCSQSDPPPPPPPAAPIIVDALTGTGEGSGASHDAFDDAGQGERARSGDRGGDPRDGKPVTTRHPFAVPAPTAAELVAAGAEPAQIVDGNALAGDDVASTIQRHMHDFTSCYKTALEAHPQLSGKVVAKFTIGADGKVTASSATGLAPEVASCIAAAIRAVEFPRPRDGTAVDHTMPFTFVAQP